MSSVRMCDRCGKVFSENVDDWSTFSGTQVKRDENGRRHVVTIQQDACPDCSQAAFQVSPKVIEATKEK